MGLAEDINETIDKKIAAALGLVALKMLEKKPNKMGLYDCLMDVAEEIRDIGILGLAEKLKEDNKQRQGETLEDVRNAPRGDYA